MMKDLYDYSLLGHNTFGIEASCRRFIEFESEQELCLALGGLTPEDNPLLLLGGGSNLLLTANYPGTVLHSAIKGHQAAVDGSQVMLRCGSGETFDDIVALCVSQGWHGMENLSLIPGEVGASAVQNIGAYGVEACDVIDSIEAIEIGTGNKVRFTAADCGYAYRQSNFKTAWRGRYMITYVTYRLSTVFSPNLEYGNIKAQLDTMGIASPNARQLREAIISIRRNKLPDPKEEGNAGSFFMNPVVSRGKYELLVAQYPGMPHYTIDDSHEKIPAGWMIDQCGWKGRTLGAAGVHARQALVLVNKGGATGRDIVRLCDAVRKDVLAKFGIEIFPEVNIV